MSTNEMSPDLEKAFALYQEGESLQAEDCMEAAVRATESRFGPGSAQYASSLYELGALLEIMGRSEDGIGAMRRACAVKIPDDTEATRDRLTYLMQLGEMLERVGELHGAEEVLRESLAARAEFYGREHAGYAFGLEPLASVVFRLGDHDAALEMTDEVIDNFWRNGHPRVATAFPLRAEILKCAQDPTPPFEGLDELPPAILEDMVGAAVERVEMDSPAIGQAILTDLLPLIENNLGQHHDATLKLRSVLANLASALGGHEGRIESIEKVIAGLDARGQREDAIDTRYGLALALSDAGSHAAAREMYAEAIALADDLGHDILRAKGLRNLGLLLSEIDENVEAEQTMRLAVGASRRSQDDEQIGSSVAALGIFLQHGGDLEQAESLLEESIDRLDDTHPSCLCARSHLQALRDNSSCGCGDMESAIVESFRNFVMERMPEGLVAAILVDIEDGQFVIGVDFDSEPTEEELELVHRTIEQAQIEFNKRLDEGS